MTRAARGLRVRLCPKRLIIGGISEILRERERERARLCDPGQLPA